jgi:hypothetical protein
MYVDEDKKLGEIIADMRKYGHNATYARLHAYIKSIFSNTIVAPRCTKTGSRNGDSARTTKSAT